ncbi:MAG: hypothetical protein GEU88_01290 [Solirubrobacterales bacterium]|nr:hypothetical protein [Solirubrobacterales bacterium]
MDLRLAPRAVHRPIALAAAALALLAPTAATLVSPAPAEARAGATAPPRPTPPDYIPPAPDGYAIGAREAVAIADRDPKVAEQSRRYGRLSTAVEAKDGNWQVGYSSGGGERAQVLVDGGSGAVRESWTGYQVAWPMARGYEGQFGHVLNAPYVWIPLCLIFLCGLLDWRRPWRIAHLDLLALLAFGVSHIFFNRGEIGVSVPLVYPLLLYLLARMLWLGFRGGEGLRPTAPALWLAIAAVALCAFRLTINVADSGVIDVGYAGTIGADRIAHGEPLYGQGEFPEDNPFGDTYGPSNYYTYVPFELALPWSGEWDELPASHAAAIAFDLATVVGLLVFALRLRGGRRGSELGAILAFGWLAYPYTAFALQSNSNDSLVAALIVWSLALFARPLARGALLALAATAKFAPLALAPLFATGERGLLARWADRRPADRAAGAARAPWIRPVLCFSLAFLVVAGLMLAHPAIDPGLATFWDRTVATQIDRESPFSVWGLEPSLGWLHTAAIAATLGLAVLVAFVPRRRPIARVAALAAAVLIAVQLTADHWFYLYIPWFAGPLLIALAVGSPRRSGPAPAAGDGRSARVRVPDARGVRAATSVQRRPP